MNSRERVQMALDHKQPDRVPVDFGATTVTGIAASTIIALREALKLKNKTVKVQDPFLMIGRIEEDMMKALNVDVAGILSPSTKFGYRNDEWKTWNLPSGEEALVGKNFNVTVDKNGDIFAYPQGDTSVPPSAKMPKGGYYFDNILRQEPIDDAKLDGKKDYSEQFKLYSDDDLKYIERVTNDYYENSEYALIGNFGGGSLGDLSNLPGPGLKDTPGIRDVNEWLMAHMLNKQYIKDAYEYQTEIILNNLKLYKQAAGDKIQVLYISGTDFGTQNGEFISPDIFRELYKPFYKRVNDWVHANTKWKTFYHSCGSIIKLMDDFVEMGVDVLNPVQCSAAGMDPKLLKEKYGDKLVFWGGGIDTQHVLPFGTPDKVKEETTERVKVFSKGGGYIFNAIHNVQACTPIENLIAMLEAINEFNS